MSTWTTRRTMALAGALTLAVLTGCGDAEAPGPGERTSAPDAVAVTTSEAPVAATEEQTSQEPTGEEETDVDGTDTEKTGADQTSDEETTAAATGEGTGGSEPTSTGPVAAPPPEEDLATADGSGCTPETSTLPDGSWFGEVTEATDEAVTFNLKCWFDGPDAYVAAEEDGLDPDHVTDGYYIRDNNPELRTVNVGDGTEAVHYVDGVPQDDVTLAYPEWVALVDRGDLLFNVWLTVEGGQVTRVEEQWVP